MNLRTNGLAGLEHGFAGLILNEFDAAHESEAPHITHVWVIGQCFLEFYQQPLTFFSSLADKILLFDDIQHGECNRTTDRMGTVGISVHPRRAAFVHHAGNLVADTNAAKWKIPGGDGLGELDEVWFHTPVLQTKHAAGAAKAGNYLI